ncbi:MAG: hypothetical protein ABJN34_04485 [Litoreibacter sp.]|uniref:hypothetical protein n=1 Tax=Litoreibacter sp. TaxID=1969459 RepID=UPI00329A54F9
MTDTLQLVMGVGSLILFTAVVLGQMGWQAYRIYSGPPMIKPVAFFIILTTLVIAAPPYEYAYLDRAIIATLLLFPLCLVTLFADPGYWKLLSLAFLIAAGVALSAFALATI